MSQNTTTYFKNFFAEKEIPSVTWEIEDATDVHIISNDFVIETLQKLPANTREACTIRDMLTRIDFANGNINHYLQHLATALVKQHAAASGR